MRSQKSPVLCKGSTWAIFHMRMHDAVVTEALRRRMHVIILSCANCISEFVAGMSEILQTEGEQFCDA